MFKDCEYHVGLGIVEMLTGITSLKKQEVWAELVNATLICFKRYEKKPNMSKSWRSFDFLETQINLKVELHKENLIFNYSTRKYEEVGRESYTAYITLNNNLTERFTSRQVEEFLVENILLESE